MAINKKNSPVWVKVVVILVAVSFVGAFIPLVVSGFSGGKPAQDGTPIDASSYAAKYQPRIDASRRALQADPENGPLLVQQGHNYFDWAAELSNAQLFDAAQPLWITALGFYEKALAINPDDAVVLGNRAFASFYSNSVNAREALEVFIATNDATLQPQIEAAKEMLAQLAATPIAPSQPGTASAPEASSP
jgi:tetratricopeptide (TPR) repeat protein